MVLEREHWIDMLRGFCMLSILFDHTEIYYTGGNLIPYVCFECSNCLFLSVRIPNVQAARLFYEA
mgnify:CR=1 FL=1